MTSFNNELNLHSVLRLNWFHSQFNVVHNAYRGSKFFTKVSYKAVCVKYSWNLPRVRVQTHDLFLARYRLRCLSLKVRKMHLAIYCLFLSSLCVLFSYFAKRVLLLLSLSLSLFFSTLFKRLWG